jgi:hypothetical protein
VWKLLEGLTLDDLNRQSAAYGALFGWLSAALSLRGEAAAAAATTAAAAAATESS